MEVKNDGIILLTDSGEFKKVKRPKEYIGVGHEYDSRNYTHKLDISILKNRRLALAMLLLLFMIPSAVSYAYFQPYGYINIDINPSIEITYNVFDRVIDVKSINDDGKIVMEEDLHISNKKTNDALENIIEKSKELGFISKEKENIVLITVTSKNKDSFTKYNDGELEDDDYEIAVIAASEEDHKEANIQGVSTAQIVISNILNKENPNLKNDKFLKLYDKFEEKQDKQDSKEEKKDLILEKNREKEEIKEEIKEEKERNRQEEKQNKQNTKDETDLIEKEKQEIEKENKELKNNNSQIQESNKNIKEQKGPNESEIKDKETGALEEKTQKKRELEGKNDKTLKKATNSTDKKSNLLSNSKEKDELNKNNKKGSGKK